MGDLYQKWLSMVDFPALILLIITLLGVYVIYKTQQDPHNQFDFADMLRDDTNKPSALRLAIFVCLAISSWAVMYIIVSTQTIDSWLLIAYMAVWSGAKVAEKLVEAYSASKIPPGRSSPTPFSQWRGNTKPVPSADDVTDQPDDSVPLGPAGNTR